jgi:hypothetical protein
VRGNGAAGRAAGHSHSNGTVVNSRRHMRVD